MRVLVLIGGSEADPPPAKVNPAGPPSRLRLAALARRLRRRFRFVELHTFLLACGGASSGSPAALEEELGSWGRYAVGYRTFDVTYERPDGGVTRSVELHVWYPTLVAEGPQPRYPFRRSENGYEAPPPAAGPFPVLAFSHGHQAMPDSATHLLEHFASHGFLAFAPMHTGNTTADGDPRETSICYLRPHDVRASLDALEALPAEDPLHGRLGTSRLVSGHSVGAYTAYVLAGARHDVDAMRAGCDAGTLRESVCGKLDANAEPLEQASRCARRLFEG